MEEIRKTPELLATNRSRYDGALTMEPGELHPDQNLHILLYDLIYCANVYDLFTGITFRRMSLREKQLLNEQKKKAVELKEKYDAAKRKADRLEEGISYFVSEIRNVDIVEHVRYGRCDVLSVDNRSLCVRVQNTGEEKKLGLTMVVGKGLIHVESEEFSQKQEEYRDVLDAADSILRMAEYATKELEPYVDYLN